MKEHSKNTLAQNAPPAGATADAGDQNPWQLRLMVSLPVLLVLVILIFGLTSFLAFSDAWEQLEDAGAGPLAQRLLWIHMVAMVVLVFVAVFIGAVLSHTIRRPIQALVEATRQVAQGRLDQHAPSMPAARELGDLSRAFNSMMDQLNRSIAERSRCLMAGIPTGVMMVDMGGKVNSLNAQAAELLGVEAGQVMNRELEDLRGILPASVSGLVDHLECLLIANLSDAEPEGGMTQEIQLGDDGKKLMISAALLRDRENVPFGVMLHLRETAHVRNVTEQIRREDQIALLGTFTLGVAHELRNPLGALKGLSQLLLLEKSLPARAEDYLTRMTHEVDRADAFIRRLFELGEQPVTHPTPTDLNEVLNTAQEITRQQLSADQTRAVEMKVNTETLPNLMLEGGRLAQALAQIIRNACEATPAGGSINLRSRLHKDNGHSACVVEISNTGSTITPENTKKIFDPFFTTRERATGLGLTIANQIVTQNGGSIEVRVEPDQVTFAVGFEMVSEKCGMRNGGRN